MRFFRTLAIVLGAVLAVGFGMCGVGGVVVGVQPNEFSPIFLIFGVIGIVIGIALGVLLRKALRSLRKPPAP